MLIAGLQTLLTTPVSQSRRPYFFWLGLSLATALGYAILALEEPLSQPYVIQDDARQYLFWMQRSLDSSLFPNDLIASYFQSVTPLGYKALYGGAIALGIHPFQFNIILPTILGLIATQYLFRLTFSILPIPFTAWIASVVFNQTIWMKDDLISATPRAFVYPLFLAFLFYWARFDQVHRRSPILQAASLNGNVQSLKSRSTKTKAIILACIISLTLLGLFYPQYVLLAGAMLGIAMITDGTVMGWLRSAIIQRKDGLKMTGSKTEFYLSTIATILIVILYYASTASDYGPVVTPEQAKAMPEFWPGGRSFFFSDNPWWFYGVGDRSGFLHVGLVRPATLALGLFLPLIFRFPSQFPLINAITPTIYRLGHLLLASTALFIAAHLLLFRLHLPSRYTDHSLRIIMAIASAIVLTLVLDALFNGCRLGSRRAGERRSRGAGEQGSRGWLSKSRKPVQNLSKASKTQNVTVRSLRSQLFEFLASTSQRLNAQRSTPQHPKNPTLQHPDTPTPQHLPKNPKSKIQNLKSLVAIAFTLFIFLLLIIYPQFVDPFPLTKYKVGSFPDTYAYLRAQPKDILVASIAKEADNIPVFAQRSILIGHEYAIPYHMGYYEQFRRRAIALLKAHYTTDKQELAQFIEGYGIDVWLLEADAYDDDYLNDHWIQQYDVKAGLAVDDTIDTSSRQRPVLQRFQSKCTVLKEGSIHTVSADCILAKLFK